jgi:hypothetical protein
VSRAKLIAAILFIAAVLTGTILDFRAPAPGSTSESILVADFHVHPYPGDGSLPTWELQREAERRGLDVLAVTGHNNRFGLEVGRLVKLDPGGAILIPGQEITTPSFHLVAVGTERLIDWRLTAREAIAAIHEQGGVAIAAHPVPASWRVEDPNALRALDGAEVAHPSQAAFSSSRREFALFFQRVSALNPRLSPIGSSDFHMTAPLGRSRTYLLVKERSVAGVLDAIRAGRTVARDGRGVLLGMPEDIARVEDWLTTSPLPETTWPARLPAVIALLALAVLALPSRSATARI